MSVKSLSKNTVIYSIGTLALRLTAFLLIPLYTHYLTKSEFGLLQILLFTVQIIIAVNDLGMRSAIMRFFSQYEKNKKLNELLGSSFTINILLGVLLIVSSLFIPDESISSLFNIKTIPNLLFFTVLLGVFQTLSLNILSYFRAKNQGITYVAVSLSTSLLLITLTYILLVQLEFGILGVLWGQTAAFILMWISVLVFIWKKHGLLIKQKVFYNLLKFGFPLIIAVSGDLIINTAGNYFLGHFRGLEDVASFSLAFKIASISIMLLIGPFQMAYEPYIFKNIENKDLPNIISRISNYILLSFLLVSFAILFIFRDLIFLIGPEEYSNAYYLIFFILPGLGATAFSYIGQSLLHIKNKTRTTGKVILYVTLLSLAAAYLLTQYFGIAGLIVSLNLYLIISSFILFYKGNSEIRIPMDKYRLFLITISGLFLYVFMYYISFSNDYIYYTAAPLMMIILLTMLLGSRFFTSEEKNYILGNFKKLSNKTI